MHPKHTANSIRKSIRVLNSEVDGGADLVEAMLAFVGKMDALANRIDEEEDAAEKAAVVNS